MRLRVQEKGIDRVMELDEKELTHLATGRLPPGATMSEIGGIMQIGHSANYYLATKKKFVAASEDKGYESDVATTVWDTAYEALRKSSEGSFSAGDDRELRQLANHIRNVVDRCLEHAEENIKVQYANYFN
ncbi:hypothetical protein GOV07_00480 [Candidatus Woesearchaeota archaeon]|nr:hypothetical protein [Candidatus Woesearchaeota archaeon]